MKPVHVMAIYYVLIGGGASACAIIAATQQRWLTALCVAGVFGLFSQFSIKEK